MKFNNLIFFVLVFCSSCQSQRTHDGISGIRDSCCAMLKIPDSANSNVSKHLIDFVKLNHIEDGELSYLCDRRSMEILELTEKANCQEIKIASSNQDIIISLKTKIIKADLLENIDVEYIPSLHDSFYIAKNGAKIFGLKNKETTSNIVSEFVVKWEEKEFNLLDDKEYYFYANMCNEYKSIKPPMAYISNGNNLLFIYLFGYREGVVSSNRPDIVIDSYMMKIIIDRDKNKVKKIVVDENILREYNWLCPNFIGF